MRGEEWDRPEGRMRGRGRTDKEGGQGLPTPVYGANHPEGRIP